MPSTKQIAREIFRQSLASIDIPAVMERKLAVDRSRLVLSSTIIELSAISRVVVIAIGKAAHAMANGLCSILPNGTSLTGVVAAPTSPAAPIPGLKYFVSGHPLPDIESLRAAEAILGVLRTCNNHTLVFFLLSGGGSALVELPLHSALSLEDVQAVHRALVTCGAPIDAMNTVRRHLSAVKGGRLSLAAASAQKITLAVTDVPLGKEAALASGPTLPDPTRVADVQRILKEYDLPRRFPVPLQRWLEAGLMPRRQSLGMRPSPTLASKFCSAWTICFMPRIMPRKLTAIAAFAIIPPTIGQ